MRYLLYSFTAIFITISKNVNAWFCFSFQNLYIQKKNKSYDLYLQAWCTLTCSLWDANLSSADLPCRFVPSCFGGLQPAMLGHQCSAHFVLLGPNNTTKKTCLSSHFEESYASTGHNGKKSCFFTQRRWRASQKTIFYRAISRMCKLCTNESSGDHSTGPHQVTRG